MNTKITVVGAAATLAATAVALSAQGPAGAQAPTHTLTFTSVQLQDRIVHDVDVATDKDLQHGTVTGYDVTSCRVNVTTHIARCDVAIARAAGLLYAHAAINLNSGDGSGVVTGGTRRFAGATGTVTVSSGPNPRVTINWTN